MAFPTPVRRATVVSATANSTIFTIGPAGVFPTWQLNTAIAAGERVLWVAIVSADGNPTLTHNTVLSDPAWEPATVAQASNGTVVTGALFKAETTAAYAASAMPELRVVSSVAEQFSAIILAFKVGSGKSIGWLLASAANGSSTNSNPPALTNNSGSSQDVNVVATRSGDSTVVATAAPTNYIDLQSIAGGGTAGASTNTARRQITMANAAVEDPATFTSATEQWVSFTFGVYEFTASQSAPTGLSSAASSALALGSQRPVGVASSAGSALALAGSYSAPIGLATGATSALPLAPVAALTAGLAVSAASALPLDRSASRPVAAPASVASSIHLVNPLVTNLDPLKKGSGVALSEGDRRAIYTNTSNWQTVLGTKSNSGGYFESKATEIFNFSRVGFANASANVTNVSYYIGEDANSQGIASDFFPFADGDTLDFFLKNGKYYVRKNNVWSGDPVAETGGIPITVAGPLFPAFASVGPTGQWDVNFGSKPFARSVPSGGAAWDQALAAELPVGLASSTGSALALSGSYSLPVGLAIASGAALSLSATAALPVAFAASTGSALPLGGASALPTGQAISTGSALPLGASLSGATGRVDATASALSLAATASAPLGLSPAIAAALSLPPLASLPVSESSAAATALSLPATAAAPIGLAIAAGSALGLGVERPSGEAAATASALSLSAGASLATGLAQAAASALPLSGPDTMTGATGVVVSVASALSLPATAARSLGIASSAGEALALGRASPVGLAGAGAFALFLQPSVSFPVGIALSASFGFDLPRSSALGAGAAASISVAFDLPRSSARDPGLAEATASALALTSVFDGEIDPERQFVAGVRLGEIDAIPIVARLVAADRRAGLSIGARPNYSFSAEERK